MATPYRTHGTHPGCVDTPAWVKDAMFYQIFPDRYAISPTLEKPDNLEPWDTDPTPLGYKGGDLRGVIEHLDDIQALGFNALYMNPIFQSASNHRYHTHDYLQVDPLLGGNEALDDLIAAVHHRGMRIILDGVFNHASRGFFQFNDVLENGAASPWVDWFTFHAHPANAYDPDQAPGYLAWWGLHALPKFNTDHPQVREYLMRVGEFWMRKGIDGWRLDVPDEITTPGFWEEFRTRIRAINPDGYIVGELWGMSEEFLSGTRFDAVMNYVFASAALAFCGRHRVVKKLQDDRAYDPWPGITGETYASKIDALLASYDWNVQVAQMNLLGSHDTPRMISLLGDDPRSVELALFLLFTFPGAPTLYYGDEIGLDGGLPDHWARKSYPWGREDQHHPEIADLVRTLTRVRAQHAALLTGAYTTLVATAEAYAFCRSLDGETLIGAINTADTASVLPLELEGRALSGEALVTIGEAPVTVNGGIRIPARSAIHWSTAHVDA